MILFKTGTWAVWKEKGKASYLSGAWLGALCVAALCSGAAYAADIALVPISASGSHTIDGNEIILDNPGQRVFLEIYISDWDPDLDGDPSLWMWQAKIDSAGYSSGTDGVVGPVSEPCLSDTMCEAALGPGSTCDEVALECEAGFQDTTRPDYIFYGLAHTPFVDTTSYSYLYYGALLSSPWLSDPGSPVYGGTLVLYVPMNALGQFTIQHHQALWVVFDQFQLIDDVVVVFLFLHLLGHVPLKENPGGMVLFADGDVHEVVDGAGHHLLMRKGLGHQSGH